jgi:hypothetical protein
MPLLSLIPGLILVVFSGCSWDWDGDGANGYVSPYDTTTVADPGNDDSSAGVYRGVLVGSQGIFQIYIANEPGVYEAHLRFDDSSCTLYTDYFTENPGWQPGDQIVHAIFQGSFPDDGTTWAKENTTIDFSAGPTGNITNDMVAVTIAGHVDPIIVLVSKERSDRMVLQYVGRAYNDPGDPWANWGLLVLCPKGSADITVLGHLIDISDPNEWWEINVYTAGDGVAGVLFTESGGITAMEDQIPTVDLTGLYRASASGEPKIKIHGEFDTTEWPDRISGWWKSYLGTWGSGHTEIDEGEWDSARSTAPPVQGGIRINITGQPLDFFDGRDCGYAICESGGNPNIPADRVAEGTISLTSGSGTSAVENLSGGQYDVFVAVDVDDDGYIFSEGQPSDGDLHGAETSVVIDSAVADVVFTLKTVVGEVSWSPALSGDLQVILCSHVSGGINVERYVDYYGITNKTSSNYAIDSTDMSGGPYYLLGLVGAITDPELMGWYADADGFAGTDPPPVNISDLQDSYDFVLSPP